MKRRVFILLAALLLAALAAGVMYAAAAPAGKRPPVNVIIVMKAKGDPAAVVAKLKERHATGVYKYHVIPAVAATMTRDTLAELRRDPNVRAVVADTRLAPIVAPPLSQVLWSALPGGSPAAGLASSSSTDVLESEALQLTHAEDAWEIEVDGQPVMGQGVRVGLLDSGVDITHPDLAPAIEAYRDFTGSGLEDSSGHGTGTASTVAAQGLAVYNPLTDTTMRIAGMAPGAKVLMAKINSGDWYGALLSQYIRAVEWLIDERVDIITDSNEAPRMQWPADGRDLYSLAVKAAIDSGITYCAAGGNGGPGQGVVPATSCLKEAISVGATTGGRLYSQLGWLAGEGYKSDQVIDWSSRGPNAQGVMKPDIMGLGASGWALAPMTETWMGQYVSWFGGTSMASPVVAGNLALAESAWKMTHPGRPLPPPSYWKNLLASTATDLGYPALDQSSGLVNGEAAVRAVLHRGPSALVSVAADPANPASWSPKVAAGGRATTTLAVTNTGDSALDVTLEPVTFVLDEAKTITRSLTLTRRNGWTTNEQFAVPAGADFVEVRCTWQAKPYVCLGPTVYDAEGKFLTTSENFGGLGHLGLAQVSLVGPPDQQPNRSGLWSVAVMVYRDWSSMDQLDGPLPVEMSIRFFHKVRWQAVSLSPATLTVKPGRSANARVDLTAPDTAGTHFGAIAVSHGSTTTVPVSVRTLVDLDDGRGTFAGTLIGSAGLDVIRGEFYFYDFRVPSGTSSVTASLSWPHEGYLANMVLVDPAGQVRDAKGCDVWPEHSTGWTDFSAPASAFTHTGAQVVWDEPRPGNWQAIVWAPGFKGDAFAEPFAGSIVLDRRIVSPTQWIASAAPGRQVRRTFTVDNPGSVALAAYAAGRRTAGGVVQYEAVPLEAELYPGVPGLHPGVPGASGQLPNEEQGDVAVVTFEVPQRARSLTTSATWTGADGADILMDLCLRDEMLTTEAVSLATSSAGNSTAVQSPLAGDWTAWLGYGDATYPHPTVDYTLAVECEAPVAISGLTVSATSEAPVNVPGGGRTTLTATITVPRGAQPGDVITGWLDFYGGGEPYEAAGGDRLGSVPVTIIVE